MTFRASSLRVFLTGFAAWMAAHPAIAQTLAQGGGPDIPWWRVVGALVFCLGLAIAVAFLLKKHLGGGPMVFGSAPRRMQLVETLRISHQINLCVVHYGDKELLIAAGSSGASLLATNDKPVLSVQTT